VSFSEPHIPFSIFVSASQQQNVTTALRIAEAVVHEAMHLQLTLVERVVLLVNLADGRYFSPWQGKYRTAQGVLHALYVFGVINSFIERLEASGHDPAVVSLDYVRRRHRQIAMEIHEIESFRYCPELTPIGTAFVRHLFPCHLSANSNTI